MTFKSAFKKELEIIHSDLIKINDWMYDTPELAFEEFKTSEYLVSYLKNFSDSGKNSKVLSCIVPNSFKYPL